MLKFTLESTHKKKRTGLLETAHGVIETPIFMPVGTRASVKALTSELLVQTDAQIILGNTYHLMLRPGAERIGRLGGLHKFMNWDKPILTDSGGYQVMSLSALRKITEEGVEFRSHIDGKKYMLTPEYSTEIQYLLDSNITMAFDECLEYPSTYEQARASMKLTSRWAERSRNAFKPRSGYGQFGIMQGGVFLDLRKESADDLINIGFDGYAIGSNLAVGQSQEIMFNVLDDCVDYLPKDKPRYLMGVGKPSDIIGAVKRGVDMFDCVLPSRSGRNGQAYVKYGTVNIRNSKYSEDNDPLEFDCNCIACKNYSKAYLHHLIRIGEITGSILMTAHNITYFLDLMKRIRKYIKEGKDIDFSA
jgi:queuine tRNA-ribosyltransferase